MLKQGVVQETIADIQNGPGALPPLNNLPQWSRVNTLDKARYPKPFLKDRLAPLPNPPTDKRRDSIDSDDNELEKVEEVVQNPQIRIQYLEKSLNFLRTQHQEVLSNLHDEIDTLKRENKELQFKIVMMQRNSPPSTSSKKERKSAKSQREKERVPSASSHSGRSAAALPQPPQTRELQQSAEYAPQDEKKEELKVIFLEEELKEVKKALKEEKNKTHYLQQVITDQQKQQKSAPPGMHMQRMPTPPAHPNPRRIAATEVAATTQAEGGVPIQEEKVAGEEETAAAMAQAPLPFNATIEPLLVNPPNVQHARPPTMHECHVIMRHLQKVSDKQAHELNQLKTDLRDVLYSHKWSPDAYLLAKAYVAADDEQQENKDSKLPKLAMRHPTRKLPDLAYAQKDTVSLPALRQTVGNKATERRKRTQILQKARVRREVLHD